MARAAAFPSEPDRRQLAAGGDGGLVHQAPGLEKLQQLLARRGVVPGAVAPDDREQFVGRLVALAFGVERDRQIEACLMIVRIGGEFAL